MAPTRIQVSVRRSRPAPSARPLEKHASRPPFPAAVWALVACLTLIGGCLRLWKLGHASLRQDEVVFVLWSFPESLQAYLENYRRLFMLPGEPAHLPLPTLIEHFVLRLGPGETIARLPAALFGTFTIPLVFLLGRRLFDTRTGVIATALTALSFFLIWYSREAYYYSPAVFFTTAFAVILFDQLEHVLSGIRPGWAGLSLLWLTGTAALLTHLIVVFFIAGLGLAAVALLLPQLRTLSPEQRWLMLKTRCLPLGVVYALCWPGVMPFLWYMMHLPNRYAHFPPWLQMAANLPKLPLQMTWGRIWPATGLFFACFVVGLLGGLANRWSRRGTWLSGGLMVFVFATYLVAQRAAAFMPHYLILMLIPGLLIAAAGMRLVGEWLAQRTRWPVVAAAFPTLALLWLGGFEIRPLLIYYELPGKFADWRRMTEWLRDSLSPGGVAFFDFYANVGMNTLPYYPQPGIRYSFSVPVNTADEYVAHDYQGRTRAVLEKFSDAVYVEVMETRFSTDPKLGGRWLWPETHFRQCRSFVNEPLLALDRLGICPYPLNYPVVTYRPAIYYNTVDDLIALHRERGDKVFRRFGAGFDYCKTADGRDWRTLRSTATIELYNVTDSPQSVELEVMGIAVAGEAVAGPELWLATASSPGGTGSVPITPRQLVLAMKHNGSQIGTVALPVQEHCARRFAALALPPGRTLIQLVRTDGITLADAPDLLVDDVRLVVE